MSNSPISDTVTPEAAMSPGDTAITDKLSRSAHDAIDRASEKAAQAEQTLRESAVRTEAQAQALAESADRKGREFVGGIQEYARKHPLESLGIAFASGLVLSRLLRR